MFVNIAGIKLASMVWLFGKKIKNISSGSHVIYTTLKLVNSRCCQDEGEDAKEMYQNAKGMCRSYRAFVFVHFQAIW